MAGELRDALQEGARGPILRRALVAALKLCLGVAPSTSAVGSQPLGKPFGKFQNEWINLPAAPQKLADALRLPLAHDQHRVDLPEFKSIASQIVTTTRLLPVDLPEAKEPVDYIYEQPPGQLLASLLPKYVETSVYTAMLESSASEHATRMRAMDAASSNAADVIEKYTMTLNRVRQASITKEIIEIVSGAAALG